MSRPPGTRVRVIGTGHALPTPDRGPTSTLVEHDGFRLVVDLGSGALQKLSSVDCHPQNLDALLLTHAHLDHIADLGPLLFAITIPFVEREQPLRVYASGPTLRRIHAWQAAFEGSMTPPEGRVTFHELSPDETLEVGPLRVTTATVAHHETSLGFRITSPRAALAVPGDTGPCDGLVALCRDADLALVECSVPDAFAMDTHLSPMHLRDLIERASPRALALTHRYPVMLSVDVVELLASQTGLRPTLPNDLDVVLEV